MIFFYELAVYIPYFLECFLLAYLMLHRNEKKAHYRRNMILLLMIGVLWQLPVSALIFINTPGFEVLFGIVKFLLSLAPLYFFVALYRTRVLSLSYIIILAILFQRWSSVFADIIVGFTPLEEEFFFVIPTNKAEPGDILLVAGKPKCVIEAEKNKLTVINYEDSTVETILPERHVFMGNTYFYGKIVFSRGKNNFVI